MSIDEFIYNLIESDEYELAYYVLDVFEVSPKLFQK